jgi:hypothetical protein
MLPPQSTVKECRNTFMGSHGNVHDHPEPSVSEFGNLLDEVPSAVIVVFNHVGLADGEIGPLRPNAPLAQHVYEMDRIFHMVNIAPIESAVILVLNNTAA